MLVKRTLFFTGTICFGLIGVITFIGIRWWDVFDVWKIGRPWRKKKLVYNFPSVSKNSVKCRERNHDYLDAEPWKNAGQVKSIWIYPIKSCAGISVSSFSVNKFGPSLGKCSDRSFLIIDGNGKVITGRKVNSTVLIIPEISLDTKIITLHYENLEPLQINIALIEGKRKCKARLRDDDLEGYDCGDEIANWLEVALKRPCRLLYHGNLSPSRTTTDLIDKFPLIKCNDTSLYADLSGYMLMSEESLTDLEKRSSCHVFPENFRPSILVEGCKAFEEDTWAYIKIGEAVFRNIKPCERCIFTTIDHKTGKRDKNMEPLTTLRKYRCFEGFDNPLCGINLGVDRVGRVAVGDIVCVLKD